MALLFWQNGAIALWDQDEAAYAGFGLRMLQTQDWLIPDFTWSAVHRKTPLHFWAIALCYKLWGASEFTTRLPGTLAVLATGGTFIVCGRGLWPLRTRAIAALICWSSLVLPVFGKVALTDGLLVWLETVALLSWLQALRLPRWYWQGLLWGAVALGLLTKGPPILVLVLGSEIARLFCLGVWNVRTLRAWVWASVGVLDGGFVGSAHPTKSLGQRLFGELRDLLRRWLLAPLAVLPIAIWIGRTIQRDGGDYVRWFLDFYLFNRLGGDVFENQTGPPGYYAGVFALAFLPWWPWLLGAIARLWQQRREQVAIWAWLTAGWWIYELIPSKLPSYALGAYPAIAILIAQQVSLPQNLKLWRWGVRSFGVLSVLIAVGLGGVAVWLRSLPLVVTSGIWLIGSVLLWRTPVEKIPCRVDIAHKEEVADLDASPKYISCYDAELAAFKRATVLSLLLLSLLWGWVIPSWSFQQSGTRRLAHAAIAILKPGDQLVLQGNFDLPSLPFYLAQQGQDYQLSSQDRAMISAQVCAVPNLASSVWIIKMDDSSELDLTDAIAVQGWFGTIGQLQRYGIIRGSATCRTDN